MNGNSSVGIDLAGFSTGKTAVVVAEHEGDTLFLNILRDHPLEKSRRGSEILEEVIEEEAEFISALVQRGPLVVDVPIDLQSLDQVFSGEILRQPIDGLTIADLYKRPVDRLFGAL